MIIRSASAADVDGVLDLWRTATTEPSTTDDAESIHRLLERSPDALLLADDGRALVGTVIAAWDGWRGGMYRLAVMPAFRRRGVGRALVSEGERLLTAHGAVRLHLIVAADQDTAQSFWTSAGYERTDQFRYVKILGREP